MITAEFPPAPPVDHEDARFEAAAQRIARFLFEDALSDPARGSAVLRAAAMLMAYLASHDPDPAQTLQVLINEHVGNCHAFLADLSHQPTGTA